MGVLCRIPGVLYQSSKAGVACGRFMAHMFLVQVGGRDRRARGAVISNWPLSCCRMVCYPPTLHACGSLAQVLAVAMSAVTDLRTRQAFVKAEQLQQQQQGGAVPAGAEAAAAKSVVMSQKAVRTAATTHKRGFVQ